MLGQMVFAVELLVADSTLETLLLAVDGHVTAQYPVGLEAAVANMALKNCVRFFGVKIQKYYVAHLGARRVFIVVRGHMILAVTNRSERLVALGALVRLVAGVDAFVRFQVAALRKPFVTVSAFVAALGNVEFAVNGQIMAGKEAFVCVSGIRNKVSLQNC